MAELKIGVMVESFRLGLKDGIDKASELGADGIQIFAVKDEFNPDLSQIKRKEIFDYITEKKLEISALCGDLGGHGFAKKEDNIWKIKRSKEIVDLAVDFNTKVVTTHIGVIPENEKEERWQIMFDAARELGDYASKKGVVFAIETGPEKTEVLKRFLDKINTPGIGVNYDPANLVMVIGEDIVQGVFNLSKYIVHTHAKDGVMFKKTDPKRIYDYFAQGGIEDLRISDYFLEKPLGEGNVNFDKYIEALNKIGYKGYFTIEREVGDNPQEDIKKAVQFLRKW
ncbi:MAG: sugar phosphate isomerase/epimerase family protein [Candidatus Firestonebacteria bacterium]